MATRRNIVLLSDGTGNSAGKITKTNIWRIYQAIDLSQGDQVAFYDDGVGSGGFKFFRYLGGAFGFGLARNVRELYETLCRHYEGKNDQILLFGFSRGAFTVRVLSGLIGHCGVIDRTAKNPIKVWRWSRMRRQELSLSSDEGLKAAVRVAYRALRKRNDCAPISKLFRWLRDRLLVETPTTEDFHQRYGIKPKPRMAFVGVFDTVSAYGLPVDEMTFAIHKWLFPLRFPDVNLSGMVDHACQALALDEARQTFHPVLWTERIAGSESEEGGDDPRPYQVWFPGVHSDVGGGYADERLSLVPALWMLREAQCSVQLRLCSDALADLTERASALGKIHDSRNGFAAFYRYKPRFLEEVTNEDQDGDGRAEVQVKRSAIHQSVFERIKATGADYAPFGLPRDYEVVREAKDPNGKTVHQVVSASQAGYETDDQRQRRAALQGSVAGLISRRRALYYVMTGIALVVVVLPLLKLPNPGALPHGFGSALLAFIGEILAYLPVPKGSQITQFWVQNAGWFWLLAGGYALAYGFSKFVAGRVSAKAQSAWGHLAGNPGAAAAPPTVEPPPRRDPPNKVLDYLKKKTLPLVLVIILFIVVPLAVAWRWYLFAPIGLDSVCAHQHAEKAPAEQRPLGVPFEFTTRDPCLNTGLLLHQGREYKATIVVKSEWQDGLGPEAYPADPSGLRWGEMAWRDGVVMAFAALLRRFWTEDWYALMGSIGRGREQAFRISQTPVEESPGRYVYTFYAWRSGRLYLFVNDALNAFESDTLCSDGMEEKAPWRCYYDNNRGSSTVTVTEVLER